MGYFVLTDGEESFICRDEGTKKYVPIKSKKHALQLPTREKAENLLRSTVTRDVRMKYHVEYIDESSSVPANIGARQDLLHRKIEDDHIDDWLRRVADFQTIIDDTDVRGKELSSCISSIDQEITDIEHFIEFGNFNAYQGWMCFKALQGMLQQRRKYKNEISVLNTIREYGINRQNITSLSSKITGEREKRYCPRKFSDLFTQK